jgi:hypothetical protein
MSKDKVIVVICQQWSVQVCVLLMSPKFCRGHTPLKDEKNPEKERGKICGNAKVISTTAGKPYKLQEMRYARIPNLLYWRSNLKYHWDKNNVFIIIIV